MTINSKIKFVIWGAGQRGKRVFHHIGSDNVVAFIDSNSENIGKLIFDKKIISMDDYKKMYKDYPILISFVGEKEGIDYLNSRNMKNYFLLSDCPGEFQEPFARDILKEHVCNLLEKDKMYALYGYSLYSIKVYEWIEEKCGKTPILFMDKAKIEEVGKVLENYKYRIENIENLDKIIFDELLVCVDKIDGDIKQKVKERNIAVRNIYDCSDGIEVYHNRDIEKFKNIYKNEKCFIVATGPSLRATDLEVLRENNIFTFSMNHIYKVFEKTKWRPNCYVVADYNMVNNYAEDVCNIDSEYAFIGDLCEEYWLKDKKENHYKFHLIHKSYENNMPDFTSDFSKKCYLGYTVTYICMQLAAYMGFSEIYLLGVDFSYADKEKYAHFFEEKKLTSTGFAKQVELAYKAAKKYTENNNIKIYNATRGGRLEIFERVDFDELFV